MTVLRYHYCLWSNTALPAASPFKDQTQVIRGNSSFYFHSQSPLPKGSVPALPHLPQHLHKHCFPPRAKMYTPSPIMASPPHPPNMHLLCQVSYLLVPPPNVVPKATWFVLLIPWAPFFEPCLTWSPDGLLPCSPLHRCSAGLPGLTSLLETGFPSSPLPPKFLMGLCSSDVT